MTPFDDRSKKLFTLFTEYLIQLGPLDLGKYDESVPELIFRYPLSGHVYHGEMILNQLQKIKGMLHDLESTNNLL